MQGLGKKLSSDKKISIFGKTEPGTSNYPKHVFWGGGGVGTKYVRSVIRLLQWFPLLISMLDKMYQSFYLYQCLNF